MQSVPVLEVLVLCCLTAQIRASCVGCFCDRSPKCTDCDLCPPSDAPQDRPLWPGPAAGNKDPTGKWHRVLHWRIPVKKHEGEPHQIPWRIATHGPSPAPFPIPTLPLRGVPFSGTVCVLKLFKFRITEAPPTTEPPKTSAATSTAAAIETTAADEESSSTAVALETTESTPKILVPEVQTFPPEIPDIQTFPPEIPDVQTFPPDNSEPSGTTEDLASVSENITDPPLTSPPESSESPASPTQKTSAAPLTANSATPPPPVTSTTTIATPRTVPALHGPRGLCSSCRCWEMAVLDSKTGISYFKGPKYCKVCCFITRVPSFP